MKNVVLVCLIALYCCASCSGNMILNSSDIQVENEEMIVSNEIPAVSPSTIPDEKLTKCNSSMPDAYQTDSYVIEITERSFYPDGKYEESNPVDFVQVSACADKEKQSRINDILKSQERWVEKGFVYEAGTSFPIIYCHSYQYLSVGNFRWFSGNPPNSFYYYTTIDMQAGQKVSLDDLVEFSEGFIEYLKYGQFIEPEYPEFDAPSKAIQEWLITLTNEEILDELNECSKEQIEFYDSDKGKYYGNGLYDRNAFRVEDCKLTIIFSKTNESEVALTAHVNDIEEFLKVPKW